MIVNYPICNNFTYRNRNQYSISSNMVKNTKMSPSFEGNSAARLPLYACLLGALTIANALPTNSSGWTKNIRVLASNSQNVMGSYLSSANLPPAFEDSYLGQLVDKLQKKNTDTIEQANEALSKEGCYIDDNKYNSLETPGAKLNIFNKKDKNKNRFILALPQGDLEDSQNFHSFLESFSRELQEMYNIPQSNIINGYTASKEDLVKNLDKIVNKINKLKNKSNVELLIVYFGHGITEEDELFITVLNRLPNDPKFYEVDLVNYFYNTLKPYSKNEGDKEGIILQQFDCFGNEFRNVKEHELKQIFKEKLKGTKTLFIPNSCFSGSLITDNAKNVAKTLSRLA